VTGGVTASINRYVARYRARGQTEQVNRAATSVSAVLCVMGTIIALLSLACFWGIGPLFAERLGPHLPEARWLIVLLGFSMALSVSMSVFGGVLTGCHRWDLHTICFVVCDGIMLLGMIAVLLAGRGVVALGAVSLVTVVGGQVARWVLAYRVYPDLHIHRKYFNFGTARAMLGFGGKTYIPTLGDMLLNQTINVLIMAYHGPLALALFARPRALVRQLRSMVTKCSFVLVSTAGSLQGVDDVSEIRKLLVDAARGGAYLCLPFLLFLALLGDDLIEVWMGSGYRNSALVAVMALGSLTTITYLPVFSILTGLNMHGRPATARFAGSCVALIAAYWAMHVLKTGLTGVALVVAVPPFVVHGVYLPIYAARACGFAPARFLRDTWLRPLVLCVPFVLCLCLVDAAFAGSPVVSLLAGAAGGGTIVGVVYWRYALGEALRAKACARIVKSISAVRLMAGAKQ